MDRFKMIERCPYCGGRDFAEAQARYISPMGDGEARLNLIPYDGSPEVKERPGGKYLYIRKRVGSRLTSTYVDVYSDDLYQLPS